MTEPYVPDFEEERDSLMRSANKVNHAYRTWQNASSVWAGTIALMDLGKAIEDLHRLATAIEFPPYGDTDDLTLGSR